MDDPAVVAGLVGGEFGLGFQHGDTQVVLLGKSPRGGGADNTAADDQDVQRVIHKSRLISGSRAVLSIAGYYVGILQFRVVIEA